MQFADAIFGPALGFEFGSDGAIQNDQPGAVGQRRGGLRVGGHQPGVVLVGRQHRGARQQGAVRVYDAVAGLDRLDGGLHIFAQPWSGYPGVDRELESAIGVDGIGQFDLLHVKLVANEVDERPQKLRILNCHNEFR
ncbi:Uncharacterised protein [Mycobacterium tuberculosis]|uniref:Uncharacterized protein n=1 Tax=Mycobacterium tuberculosis TaxID=1773 RepID=A0A655AF19_MYCTX|nr:Uncharacterised protein [Mycobacterium tuberculosis]